MEPQPPPRVPGNTEGERIDKIFGLNRCLPYFAPSLIFRMRRSRQIAYFVNDVIALSGVALLDQVLDG
jgi:hypothetical protein